MNHRWDLLLEWMTHLGSGAWGSFREAVGELVQEEKLELPPLIRTLRRTMSDLGHVDFFADGSRRWHVLRPALVGLSGTGEHLFVGGRTRPLVKRLLEALTPVCAVTVTGQVGPSIFQVFGDPSIVARVAEKVGVSFIPAVAGALAGRLPSVRLLVDAARPAQAPINWTLRSWSFHRRDWVCEKLEKTVREYSNRFGVRRYLVHAGRTGLIELDKRLSIYGAAFLRRTRLSSYECKDRQLVIPWWAPLPDLHARAACLSGGQLGILHGESIVFKQVDPGIASALLVSLGQSISTLEVPK